MRRLQLCLAACIARQEGFLNGNWVPNKIRSRPVRHNNPGNIMQKTKTGYVLRTYATATEGWQALLELLQRVPLARNYTIWELIEGKPHPTKSGQWEYAGYASSRAGNNSRVYALNVGDWLGIDPYKDRLRDVAASGTFTKVPTEAIQL